MMKHEAVRGRLGTGGVQEEGTPGHEQVYQARRQALYRQVGEFGAGVGGEAVVKLQGPAESKKQKAWGMLKGVTKAHFFCIVPRRGRRQKRGGVGSEIELKILSQIQKIEHGATKQQVVLRVLHAQPALGTLHVEAKLGAQRGCRQFWVQIPTLLISHVTSEMLLIFCQLPFSL